MPSTQLAVHQEFKFLTKNKRARRCWLGDKELGAGVLGIVVEFGEEFSDDGGGFGKGGTIKLPDLVENPGQERLAGPAVGFEVTDFAFLGLGFLVRFGSRVLRARVTKKPDGIGALGVWGG